MKKVLFVCQYAQQPPLNNMYRYHNFGKELVKRGWDVTIVTSSMVHNTTIDVIEKLGNDECISEGVKYMYVRTNPYQGNGLKRILNMYTFCKSIKKYSYLNPDIVVVGGAYAFKYAKKAFKNAPIILDILDLWPQSIVEYANKSAKNPFIQYLYYIEKKAYLKADAVVFSIEGGKDYLLERHYSNKIDYRKIFYINMGIDLTLFDKEKSVYKSNLKLNRLEFNIGYCGSIRQANNVGQICRAAKLLLDSGDKRIKFHIFGNGTELNSLKDFCLQNNVFNVCFYGRIEKAFNPFILSSMDANILTYKQTRMMKYGGSQSKLFDALASGRPIICVGDFGYNIISEFNSGLVIKEQDPDSIAASILSLSKLSSTELNEMGLRARNAAEMYSHILLTDQLENVFNFVKMFDD